VVRLRGSAAGEGYVRERVVQYKNGC